MSNVALFALGGLVTLLVGGALALLVWGASRDGRYNEEQREARRPAEAEVVRAIEPAA